MNTYQVEYLSVYMSQQYRNGATVPADAWRAASLAGLAEFPSGSAAERLAGLMAEQTGQIYRVVKVTRSVVMVADLDEEVTG